MANQNLSSRLNVGVAQIVVPGTSSGLVSASGLTGNTTGSAIAAGFVGQLLTLTSTNTGVTTSGAYNNVMGGTTGLSVPAGVWLFYATVTLSAGTATGITSVAGVISTTTASGTGIGSDDSSMALSVGAAGVNTRLKIGPVIQSISSTTTYYLNAALVYSSAGTAAWAGPNCSLNALRIA